MTAKENQDSDFITRVRQQNKIIWEAIGELQEMQRQWNALDYSNSLTDGQDENEGINKAEVGAVVFDTTDALLAVLNEGHATNMAKLL
jgi:hypothetical protein